MEHCKLEDGMIFKVLQTIKRNGDTLNVYPVDKIYIESKRKMIYDDTGILRKIRGKVMESDIALYRNLYSKFVNQYIICIHHDNKVKYTFIGKSLFKVLENYDFNTSSNDYLKINMEMVGPYGGNHFPDYKNSQIVQRENNVDYAKLLINNEVYIEDIVKRNNISNNIGVLKEEGLYVYLSEVISDERDKKISDILS